MTSRRDFMAASLAVPMIVTLEPSKAVDLHSPPPTPNGQVSTTSKKEGGVLAFTGQPLDKQAVTGLAIIAGGIVAMWVAKRST